MYYRILRIWSKLHEYHYFGGSDNRGLDGGCTVHSFPALIYYNLCSISASFFSFNFFFLILKVWTTYKLLFLHIWVFARRSHCLRAK